MPPADLSGERSGVALQAPDLEGEPDAVDEFSRVHGLGHVVEGSEARGLERASHGTGPRQEEDGRRIGHSPAGLQDLRPVGPLHGELGHDEIEGGGRFRAQKVFRALEDFGRIAGPREHAGQRRPQVGFVLDQGQTHHSCLLLL